MDLEVATLLIVALVLACYSQIFGPTWVYIVSSDPKAIKMGEEARRNLAELDSGLQGTNYGGGLSSRCSHDEEKRPRFAWDLADCYQRNSGRSPLPRCDDQTSSMLGCRKKLDRYEELVYLLLYMEANNICSHFQGQPFNEENEKTDGMLRHALEKLAIIEEKLNYLWQNLNKVYKIRITFKLDRRLRPSIVF